MHLHWERESKTKTDRKGEGEKGNSEKKKIPNNFLIYIIFILNQSEINFRCLNFFVFSLLPPKFSNSSSLIPLPSSSECYPPPKAPSSPHLFSLSLIHSYFCSFPDRSTDVDRRVARFRFRRERLKSHEDNWWNFELIPGRAGTLSAWTSRPWWTWVWTVDFEA